jgi:hypothetical protein
MLRSLRSRLGGDTALAKGLQLDGFENGAGGVPRGAREAAQSSTPLATHNVLMIRRGPFNSVG